jgi:hypothetical protein
MNKYEKLSTKSITTIKLKHHYISNSESKLQPWISWEDNYKTDQELNTYQ